MSRCIITSPELSDRVGQQLAKIYIWAPSCWCCIEFCGVVGAMRVFLVVLSLLAVAVATRCPFSAMEPLSRSKRNAFEIRPAVSDGSLDALIKDFMPKYKSNSVHNSWAEPSAPQKPLRCGIPPRNCLNDTRNVHYRTLDGSCNNLLYPEFGISVSPYRRLLPPRQVEQAPNARIPHSEGKQNFK